MQQIDHLIGGKSVKGYSIEHVSSKPTLTFTQQQFSAAWTLGKMNVHAF